MSLKFKFISALAVGGAIALFSGASLAQDTNSTTPQADKTEKHQRGDHRGMRHGGREGMRGPGGGMFGGMKGIELSDAQKAQIKQLRQANKPDPATFQEMHTLMLAVHDGSSTPEQQTRLKELSQQMMTKQQAMRDQLLAILTPEQKVQLEKNKADRKARREEFKQKREEWRKNRRNKNSGTANPLTTSPSNPGTEN